MGHRALFSLQLAAGNRQPEDSGQTTDDRGQTTDFEFRIANFEFLTLCPLLYALCPVEPDYFLLSLCSDSLLAYGDNHFLADNFSILSDEQVYAVVSLRQNSRSVLDASLGHG